MTVPKHIGIIMDGNRRWAKAKRLPSLAGHKAGAENVKKILKIASKAGIQYLTLWALSTENIHNRSPEEMSGIVGLINHTEKYLGDALENNLRFETIGDIKKLPEKSQQVLQRVKEKTAHNTGIVLTIALVYGGQDEILRATKKIISDGLDPETMTPEVFRSYLDTALLPVPDLIVRTGGDIRHSGFLLYDSAYSEYYFSKKLWPDYNEDDFQDSIQFFENSKRNFGE